LGERGGPLDWGWGPKFGGGGRPQGGYENLIECGRRGGDEDLGGVSLWSVGVVVAAGHSVGPQAVPCAVMRKAILCAAARVCPSGHLVHTYAAGRPEVARSGPVWSGLVWSGC